MTCDICGREHPCDDPGCTHQETRVIVRELKAQLTEARLLLREVPDHLETDTDNPDWNRYNQELIGRIAAALANGSR